MIGQTGHYGDVASAAALPDQDPARLLLLAERWQRAATAHERWAIPAKLCIDFLESRQWSEDERRLLREAKRPHETFNKISPLVRLVLGYFANNKTDIKFLPAFNGISDDQIAEVLTRLEKAENLHCDLEYTDAEVFLDGITTGRGYFDDRLSFEHNDFGERRSKALDPFAVYIDPDAQDYDPNATDGGWGFVINSSWMSPDEIGNQFGQQAADLVAPLAKGYSPIGPVWATQGIAGEITPVRRFGFEEDGFPEWGNSLQSLLGDYVDPLRKNLRVLDFQYRVTERKRVFIDLETGDRKTVPDYWGPDKVAKTLYWANEVAKNPMTVQVRPVQRLRWTTVAGDLIVHDEWSPYDTYTITPYFPYFRRGQTRGMVEDLIGPQREINKRRNANIETVMRTANSGWMYHATSLDPRQETNLKKFGAVPGIHIKWKGDKEPQKIEPSPYPEGLAKLEGQATDDIRQISGINESALGELDRVQSGRAIEARQRQAVIALQLYLDNYNRTKKLQGRKHLEIYQDHYTEQRIFRVEKDDGQFMQLVINQQQMDPASGAITKFNDISLGNYSVSIDETPLSADFANAQFEEAMSMMKQFQTMGFPMLPFAETLIDLSTMPRKEEIKADLRNALQAAAGATPGGAPSGPPAAPPPGPGGAPPPNGPAPGNAPSLGEGKAPGGPGGTVIPLRGRPAAYPRGDPRNQRKFFRNDATGDRSLGIFGDGSRPEALFHVRSGDFFEVEYAAGKRVQAEDGLTEIDADDHGTRAPAAAGVVVPASVAPAAASAQRMQAQPGTPETDADPGNPNVRPAPVTVPPTPTDGDSPASTPSPSAPSSEVGAA